MATTTTSPAADFPRSLLIDRIKLVITHPTTCWQTIAAESRPPRELFTSLLLPLLALGTVAWFLGLRFFSTPALLESTALLLKESLFLFLLSCAMPFISAFVLKQLAPFFQANAEYSKGFSWAVHSSLPMLVAKILGILPTVGVVASFVAAFWSLYTSYAGLPSMAQVPKSQHIALFICFLVAMVVVAVLVAITLRLLLP